MILVLDDAGAALLESMTIETLIHATKEFDGVDQKREPEQYRIARLRLVTAAQILAQLTHPQDMSPGPLLPGAELPRCIHGVLSTDPCDECAAGEFPKQPPPEVEPQMVGIEP